MAEYKHPEVLVTTEWAVAHANDTKVRLVLAHEEYNGKTRARVRFINAYREQVKLEADKVGAIHAAGLTAISSPATR